MIIYKKSLLALTMSLALGACSSMNTPPSNTSSYPPSGNYNSSSTYGTVQSIDLIQSQAEKKGIGLGTVAGAVVGGIVGNQVGDGRGKTAATVIGAAGGAYAGHKIENRDQQQVDVYRITIRMNDGSYRTVDQTSAADLRVGDRVQIDNGQVRRN